MASDAWLPDIAGAAGPKYKAVTAAISAAVARGELRHGDRLPPQRDLAVKLGIDLTPGEISEILTDAVIQKLDAEIVWRPGVLELMADLKANGVKTALVTMSMRRMALRVAAKLPVGQFDVVVAGDDVTHGKPHPEPYLLAAEQLGVDIKDCIALEDSVTGLTSAEASGAIAIGIPNIVQLPEQEGRLIWPTLQGVNVETLAGLHKQKRAQTD